MRENITKDTFEMLKKLRVVNDAAKTEMDRLDKKEKEEDQFDEEFWYDSDME